MRAHMDYILIHGARGLAMIFGLTKSLIYLLHMERGLQLSSYIHGLLKIPGSSTQP